MALVRCEALLLWCSIVIHYGRGMYHSGWRASQDNGIGWSHSYIPDIDRLRADIRRSTRIHCRLPEGLGAREHTATQHSDGALLVHLQTSHPSPSRPPSFTSIHRPHSHRLPAIPNTHKTITKDSPHPPSPHLPPLARSLTHTALLDDHVPSTHQSTPTISLMMTIARPT